MGRILADIVTVFWRDWIVLKRRLVKFILSRMVAPLLYLVAFGWGLGRSIQVESGSYLDFLVPGILALNSMNISFNSITPVHAERVYHKSLEEYIIAPIWPDAFVIGKVLAAVLRGLISSAIILVLNCVVFAEIGFLAAMKLSTYEAMAQVNTYILLPMSFLCGTFFKTAALPEGIRHFIELLPLTHTSTLLRALSAGEALPWLSLMVLLAYAFLCFWLGRRAFRQLTY